MGIETSAFRQQKDIMNKNIFKKWQLYAALALAAIAVVSELPIGAALFIVAAFYKPMADWIIEILTDLHKS